MARGRPTTSARTTRSRVSCSTGIVCFIRRIGSRRSVSTGSKSRGLRPYLEQWDAQVRLTWQTTSKLKTGLVWQEGDDREAARLGPALRLGFRQITSMRQNHAERLVDPRRRHGRFTSNEQVPPLTAHPRTGAAGATLAPAAADTPTYRATITRTEHDIPHIVAEDWGSLGFGSGYAAAETSICTLADTVLAARGQRIGSLGRPGPGHVVFRSGGRGLPQLLGSRAAE